MAGNELNIVTLVPTEETVHEEHDEEVVLAKNGRRQVPGNGTLLAKFVSQPARSVSWP